MADPTPLEGMAIVGIPMYTLVIGILWSERNYWMEKAKAKRI
jgi:hypothetical protein